MHTTAWLQSFDAYAVAVQGNLVITMPNMDFVPQFHHFEEENVQARADGRFGVIDCFQWPQAYDNIFCNSVCIPRKELYPFPHTLHWAWFTPDQKDFKAIPGNSFPVGTLASDKVEGLESLLKMADKRVQDWRANRQGKNDVIVNRVASLRHGISQLKKHPLTFRNLLIFVTDAQHLFLEIHSFMDWVLIVQPRISSSIRANTVNSAWMGAFTHDSDMCNKLHMAGVPVWYVRTMAYISANMKVMKPVLITHPDDIVISMYAEGNKIRPYDIIYRGQGGHQHQLHVRRLYGGTTFKNPDGPVASTCSFSTPSSSTLPSCSKPSAAGKAPQKKARPTQLSQSGESRDKWKDPESPYLPLSILHWDDALKTCTKDPSCLPEHLQGYIATWLACRPLWICRVDHDPPRNYPSPQLWCDFLGSGLTTQSQGAAPKGKDPEKKGLMAAEKRKAVMRDLFGDDVLETHRDLFAPEGSVEFRGEQVSVASLANPPCRLAQRITWELYELGFHYELRDLDRHLVHKRWADDPTSHEQLLHSIFPGEAGLVMWSEPFPGDNYGMWNNTLIGVLPYLEKFRELLCAWNDVPPPLVVPLTPENFTDTKCWEVMHAATAFYVQTFFRHFGRPHRSSFPPFVIDIIFVLCTYSFTFYVSSINNNCITFHYLLLAVTCQIRLYFVFISSIPCNVH
ncbi:uncharacterized protein HD556DRAFT_1235591 [Suillus plorans]|uniref:Uncharacterized protein n=1 Tax=Suillus plorans TaxID=116603 RepID=A0A9P7ASA2_9AGAM|nr:uncharacterized protein HD556DRAFT_1235591 [Suillus plorans]KAG1795442.1 hypothetical protein HD556DRAFT_1235591 [Suillus plorans]